MTAELHAIGEAAGVDLDVRIARERQAFRGHLPLAEVVFGDLTADEVELAARLRWLQAHFAGVESLPLAALAARGVLVTNARIHAAAVADHALALLLALARGLPQFIRQAQQHTWKRASVVELEGLTMGIVGFGVIGRAVAQRARAFGMRVIACRRHPAPDPLADRVVGPEGLYEVLGACDAVVCVAPLTPETEGLFGEEAFRRMKPGAWFINLGRGGHVDEAALARALQSGHLAGAALDVCQREPLPPDHPLWELPNLLLTPHVGGFQRDYLGRAFSVFASNLRRYLAGAPLEFLVDPQRGY